MNKILKAVAAQKVKPPRIVRAGELLRHPLPLSAYYGGEPGPERIRQDFYVQMARFYGFENWSFPTPYVSRFSDVQNFFGGRDGAAMDVVASRKNVLLIDSNAAPFEWLVLGKWFEDRDGKAEETWSKDIASIRSNAGLAFRMEMSKAEISGLKSPDLGGVPSTGSGPKPIAQTKLEAIFSIGQLREDAPKELFDLLNRVVWEDEWLFRRPDRQMRGEKKPYVLKDVDKEMIGQVICAIDCAAVHYDLLPLGEFRERWPSARYRPIFY